MAETNGLRRDDLVLPIQPRMIQPSLSHKEEQQLAAQPFHLESSPYADDFLALKKRRKQRRRRYCVSCCVGTLVPVVVTVVTLAVLAFTSQDPKISIDSTTLKSTAYATDPNTKKQAVVSVTLLTEMSVKNPNKISSFEFADSKALVTYSGSTIGQAAIPAGKIDADRTAHMNITMTVFVARLLSNSSLVATALAGNITLTSYARLPGRIKLLHIINRHVTVTATCTITANLATNLTRVDHCSRHVKY